MRLTSHGTNVTVHAVIHYLGNPDEFRNDLRWDAYVAQLLAALRRCGVNHHLRSVPDVDADVCFMATADYYVPSAGGFSWLMRDVRAALRSLGRDEVTSCARRGVMNTALSATAHRPANVTAGSCADRLAKCAQEQGRRPDRRYPGPLWQLKDLSGYPSARGNQPSVAYNDVEMLIALGRSKSASAGHRSPHNNFATSSTGSSGPSSQFDGERANQHANQHFIGTRKKRFFSALVAVSLAPQGLSKSVPAKPRRECFTEAAARASATWLNRYRCSRGVKAADQAPVVTRQRQHNTTLPATVNHDAGRGRHPRVGDG